MVLPRLVLSHLAVHKVRAALTSAAVALAAALVVAVTSGYLSLETSAFRYLSRYTGFGDVEITSKDYHGTMDESVVDDLRRDPAVRLAVGRLETQRTLLDSRGRNIVGSLAEVIGVRPQADEALALQSLEEGRWFDSDAGDEAVVDQVVAEVCPARVGDTVLISSLPTPLRATVVGIVRKPQIIAEFHSQTIYLPLRTLQKLDHREGRLTRAMVVLKDRGNADDFAAAWSAKLASQGLEARTAHATHDKQRSYLVMVRFLSQLGGAIALTTAAFIIFASLSAGVAERSRTLALLRAIGAPRAQLVRLVLLEGLVIAVAGVVIGVPAGWLLVRALAQIFPVFFAAGVVLSPGGIVLATCGALAAVMAAAAVPAWMASRVDPLAAMRPQAAPASGRPGWLCFLGGLALIAVDPLWVNLPGLPAAWKMQGHFFLGLPCLFGGFFLVAPSLIRLLDALGSPLAARVLGVEPSLLRQQLSTGLWRGAGTCAALMVGLAILVVLQTQGRTVLSAWRLPQKFPDIFLWSPDGLDAAQQESLAHLPGLRNEELLPVAYALVDLAAPPPDAAVLPSTTMLLAADPVRAMAMMELEYRDDQGRPVPADRQRPLAERAETALLAGRAVVITNELHEIYGWKIGDAVPLRTPSGDVVNYRVAGIVWSPGVDVFIAVFDLGEQLDRPSASCMLTTPQDLRRDFGVDRVNFFAANLRPGADKQLLVQGAKAALRNPRAGGGWSVGRALEQLRGKILGAGIKTGDVRGIKAGITLGLQRLVDLMSTIALAAMAVAALGVANAIMAGIRSRRWQLGVLRSIGLVRAQLLRLVLAEAILLGVVGCAMGLAAGLILAVDANVLNRAVFGIDVALAPPWRIIGAATLLVMAVAGLAGLWPAIHVARVPPLKLLQAGRAAT